MTAPRLPRSALVLGLLACSSQALSPRTTETATGPAPTSQPDSPPIAAATATCGDGRKLRVRAYDVGQALAALVELPDGRHILVDTGDTSSRASLVAKLRADLHGLPIDLLWITHPHMDHLGGAADVLEHFTVGAYVDNGRDLTAREVKEVRNAATARSTPVTVVEPGHVVLPLASTASVRITAIAPTAWVASCNSDRNECSILLRIDYCASSVLFTGDAEKAEEALVDTGGPVTLLQVGHHGSDTSSSPPFVARLHPRYAFLSAGKPGEGSNRTYCHPRASTVRALTTALGGPGAGTLTAFDAAVSCRAATSANWLAIPSSDRLWATERDGDLSLTTVGDGTFVKE